MHDDDGSVLLSESIPTTIMPADTSCIIGDDRALSGSLCSWKDQPVRIFNYTWDHEVVATGRTEYASLYLSTDYA